MPASPINRGGGRLDIFSLVFLLSLLVRPSAAMLRLSLHPGIPAVVLFLVNTITFLAYRADKRRAQAREWRISESTLHLLELIGGWPAAFVAQRCFRHKIRKLSYQLVFWMIVLIYQAAALDISEGGEFSAAFLRAWDTERSSPTR